MAGNNLFGGLNSGDSSKYKKAGEQAAKRERAEQLDARIDKFLAKKQDIEWAKEALSFVDEETKLNSDIFDLSLNASRLKEIKDTANYIIEKKKKDEAEALKKRIDGLDERIAELNKELRSVAWAERALMTFEKEEEQNADIIKSIKNYAKIKMIKAEAEKIIENDIAEKEAARKAEEAEKRRIAAEKKAEEERLAAARKAEEERIAREKEEKRISESAADIDKLIFDLSRAQKSAYWCEDVKNAQKIVNKLDIKIRAKCKNLAVLIELAGIAQRISEAYSIDEQILTLIDDCARNEKKYYAVIELDKKITDSIRPYLKNAEKFKNLLKKAKDYAKKEEDKEEAKKAAEEEKRRIAAEKKAEEEKFSQDIDKYRKLLDDFILEAKSNKDKYYEAENFLSSIPERVLKYLDEKKLYELKSNARWYVSVDGEQRQAAAEKEKKIEEVLKAFKEAPRENYEGVICTYRDLTDNNRKYISPFALDGLQQAYNSAVKIRDQVKYDEAEAKRKRELEELAMSNKREKRAKKIRTALFIVLSLLIVGAAVGTAYFVPSIRGWVVAGGAFLFTIFTFIVLSGLFGRPLGMVFPIIVHILAVIVSAVCIVIFCAESALVPLLILIGIEAFMLIVFAVVNASRRLWSVIGILILASIAAVVALSAYKVLDVDFGKIFGNINVSGASLNIGVCAVAVLIYAIIWFRLEARYGRNESVAVLAAVNVINPFVLIACIVLSAMGGEYVPAGVACGIGAFLAYLSCCTVGKEGNNSLVATGMLGVSVVIASASVGLSFFEAGWTRGLVIGFPCLVSFMPFFVAFFVKIYNRDITHWAPLCFVLTVLGVGLGVMAIVGSVNYPGYMIFLNCASLFYAVLAVVSLFVLGAYDADFAPAAGLAIFIVVFLLVAVPISIVQMVGHVKAYNGTAEILSLAKQFISILK